MGDLPSDGAVQQSLDISATGHAHDEHQSSFTMPGLMPKSSGNNAPFYSQLNSISLGQLRPDVRSHTHSTSPQYPTQEHNANPLNMGTMASALPEYSIDVAQSSNQGHQHGQRPLSGASTSALVYQIQQQQQNLQMSGHVSGSLPTHSAYGPVYAQSQYQQGYAHAQSTQHANYAPFPPNQQRMAGPNSMPNPYQQYAQPSQYMYYPSPYSSQAQFSQGYPPQGTQTQGVYGRRPSLSGSQAPSMGQNMELSQHEVGYAAGNRPQSGGLQGEMGPIGPMYGGAFMPPVMNRPGPVSSIPRGPPRKPKQSGHALWVGNLPPGTTVVALKDHFSRDATKDIESLFLISKSNCAFVNYRTEASCTAAMHRFHDSRFNGVRLVCRLRRSSAPASGVPTGPSAMLGTQPPVSVSPTRSIRDVDVEDTQGEVEESATLQDGDRGTSTASEKYFIVKSLTLQDLELSVRNGIWATQSHNEEALNKAFNSAENVYLIFSANKSGEYFGYARMTSPILEDATNFITSAPKHENILDAPDVPKSIPTPATEFAPKGRIIDDSARGTIFWEAQLSDSEGEDGDQLKEQQQMDADASTVAQSWGKPFKIEWISTNRLPFYRTRGLRNPWNANREVKIARDGTELETSVGERLIQMFHRLGPSSAAAPMMQAPQLGVPQMRPY